MINMSMNIHSIYINIIKMNMNTINIINKRRVPAPCSGAVSRRRVPAPCPGAVSRHCVNNFNITYIHINMINMSMNIRSIYIQIIKMNMMNIMIINKRRLPASCQQH